MRVMCLNMKCTAPHTHTHTLPVNSKLEPVVKKKHPQSDNMEDDKTEIFNKDR